MPEEWIGAVEHACSGCRARAQPIRGRDAGARRGAAGPRGLSRSRSTSRATARSPPARQAAGRRPAAARALPSRPRVRPRGARLAVRQDRGVDHRRGRPRRRRLGRLQAPGRARRGARLDATRRTPPRCSRRCTRSRSRAGDAVFVPAGTPHAIGDGILMLELQEPTDFSVHARVGGLRAQPGRRPPEARLGPRAAGAGPRRVRPAARGADPAGRRRPVLPRRAHHRRRLARCRLLDSGRARRSGTLATEGGDLALRKRQRRAGPVWRRGGEHRGDVDAIRCRPPAPDAGDGEW